MITELNKSRFICIKLLLYTFYIFIFTVHLYGDDFLFNLQALYLEDIMKLYALLFFKTQNYYGIGCTKWKDRLLWVHSSILNTQCCVYCKINLQTLAVLKQKSGASTWPSIHLLEKYITNIWQHVTLDCWIWNYTFAAGEDHYLNICSWNIFSELCWWYSLTLVLWRD